MSSDNGNNGGGGGVDGAPRQRRSSITQAALSNLFQRGASTSGPASQGSAQTDQQRRRLSVTTLGLSGSGTNNPPAFGMRRSSMSTNSDSIDESAIDEEEGSTSAKAGPNTPFARRMSVGGTAMRGYRNGNSPGNGKYPISPPLPGQGGNGDQAPARRRSSVSAALAAERRGGSGTSPASALPQASNTKHPRVPSDNASSRADQQGFNWSEQLRSRAESSVSGARPTFPSQSSSPPRTATSHDRAKSVSDMPQPPLQASAVKPRPERVKPDAFQERILKGDFYMD